MAANNARLTIDDLKDVKKALWPARNKWRDIGTEIGEAVDSLESIDMTNRKPEDCLREMLSGWLRGAYNPNQKNSKPRTWRTLIDALREKEIGLTDLANNIEKEKYGISVPAAPVSAHATPTAAHSLPPNSQFMHYQVQGLPQQGQGYYGQPYHQQVPPLGAMYGQTQGVPQQVQGYHGQPYYQQVPPPGAMYGQTQGGFAPQPGYQTGLPAQQPTHYYGPNQGGYTVGHPPSSQPGGGMQSAPNTQLVPPSTPGQPAPSPQAVHQSPGLPAGAAMPQPMPGSNVKTSLSSERNATDSKVDRQELGPLCVKMLPDEPALIDDRKLLPPEQLNLQSIHSSFELKGQGIEIAILDTGIRITHEVFESKGTNEISGHNFFPLAGNDQPKDASWQIPGLHGTAVAAIAAGNEYESHRQETQPGTFERFYAGIAPKAKLYICRISDGIEYPWNCLIEALDHLIEIKKGDSSRIDIAVMSFGSEHKKAEVEAKLRQLADSGVILIAAGGNQGAKQDDTLFPSSDCNVIPVGAIGPDGRKAGFSTDHAHVFAPGGDIFVPSIMSDSKVCKQHGTSFAAPMVAGFLALLLQCAKESGPKIATPNVLEKYHSVNFLKSLLRHHKLVKENRLFYANELLEDLRENSNRILKMIKDQYTDFMP